MGRNDLRSLIGLLLASAAAFLMTAALPRPPRVHAATDPSLPRVGILIDTTGEVRLSATRDVDIRYTLDGSDPDLGSDLYTGPFTPDLGTRTARLIATPTSVQWRHPVGTFPSGTVVRARAFDEHARSGPISMRSSVPEAGGLAVVSLTIPEGALFDLDTGIYVLGHAVFRTQEDFVRRYPRDQKWWKYPGNFHLRGRAAERDGHIEVSWPDGEGTTRSTWSYDAAIRINGNNTRGFPQHALRLTLDRPKDHDLVPDRIILRAAGNDQDHVFFRDALQHGLCAKLPFATSRCDQSVVYVNGAYWGLHNIRLRTDEKAIARVCGVKPKEVTIIEDRIVLYEGREEELKTFSRFLTMTERWDSSGQAFVDSLERRMDVDGFLSYMAAQIILANTDWPEQNVRWWRYTGVPDMVPGYRDGRWRFIMGDSDMGMGLATGPDYDMFAHIDRHPHAPIARLFKACLRSRTLTERFSQTLDALLQGPLSEHRMETELIRMRDAIASEMPTHIRRWRRPLSVEAWENHVEVLRTFAALRPTAVRRHAAEHLPGRTP